MTVEERLARIESSMEAHVELFRIHTDQDMQQFTEVKSIMTDISHKVDDLRIKEATRIGALESNKRIAGFLGGGTAAFMVGIIEVVKYFVG